MKAFSIDSATHGLFRFSRGGIERELYAVLCHGAKQLSDDAKSRMKDFVLGQKTTRDTFCNRAGCEDLYYTLFGWALCAVLDIQLDPQLRQAYLQEQKAVALDDFHRSILLQCFSLDRLMRLGKWKYALGWLLKGCPDVMTDVLTRYLQHIQDPNCVNAIAAQCVLGKGEMWSSLYDFLDDSGGFRFSQDSALPDVLSTGVALFAWHWVGVPIRDRHLNFIDAHWQEDGGFVDNLLDEKSDLEYTFYGLLAIGCR